MELIALKRLPYRTRHMEAGDTSKLPIQVGEVFKPASEKLGRILIAIKKARDPNHRKPGSLPPPPASLAEKIAPPVEDPAAPVEPPQEAVAAHDESEHEESAPAPQTEPEAESHAAEPEVRPEIDREYDDHSNEPEHQKASLRNEAESLGLVVDGRWGIERLRAEIDAARVNHHD